MRGNQRGQALLEISITIGVAAIVIGALAITTITGLKNSQFAQNQTQATKLAQEALERMRSMRNRNLPICIGAGNTEHFWITTPSVWSYAMGNITSNCNNCQFKLQTGQTCELTNSATPELLLQGKFKRLVFIEDEGSNQKKITAQVTWEDSSGSHESKLITILADY